ncbi:MAG: hypothetical protein LBN20_01345, partial [Endomicrobium sp.]|nr:hypothetical protein [Endomicrobium sp.]
KTFDKIKTQSKPAPSITKQKAEKPEKVEKGKTVEKIEKPKQPKKAATPTKPEKAKTEQAQTEKNIDGVNSNAEIRQLVEELTDLEKNGG